MVTGASRRPVVLTASSCHEKTFLGPREPVASRAAYDAGRHDNPGGGDPASNQSPSPCYCRAVGHPAAATIAPLAVPFNLRPGPPSPPQPVADLQRDGVFYALRSVRDVCRRPILESSRGSLATGHRSGARKCCARLVALSNSCRCLRKPVALEVRILEQWIAFLLSFAGPNDGPASWVARCRALRPLVDTFASARAP